MSHVLISQVIQKVSQVVLGKEDQVRLSLTCLLAKGHLLIEDLPGMGKTTLSHALADALGLNYKRIQFTNDLLPSDILGTNIYNRDSRQFEFHPGPIFTNVLLADEINRASPKTQSALLEAMEEKQVTIDGVTHQLPEPFFVIATQNPLSQSGTNPLPESQMDRFLMQISLGFPSMDAEKEMLKDSAHLTSRHDGIENLMTAQEMLNLQQKVHDITVSDAVLDYILRLVQHSRTQEQHLNPLSPRASKAILAAAKTWAMISERDFVTPDDVQKIFTSVAEHRIRDIHYDVKSSAHSTKILKSIDVLGTS